MEADIGLEDHLYNNGQEHENGPTKKDLIMDSENNQNKRNEY